MPKTESGRLPNGDHYVVFDSGFKSITKVDEMIGIYYNIIEDENHPLQRHAIAMRRVYEMLIEELMARILRDHGHYEFK